MYVFVHDYRNSIGKLEPRAVKCVLWVILLLRKGTGVGVTLNIVSL